MNRTRTSCNFPIHRFYSFFVFALSNRKNSDFHGAQKKKLRQQTWNDCSRMFAARGQGGNKNSWLQLAIQTANYHRLIRVIWAAKKQQRVGDENWPLGARLAMRLCSKFLAQIRHNFREPVCCACLCNLSISGNYFNVTSRHPSTALETKVHCSSMRQQNYDRTRSGKLSRERND